MTKRSLNPLCASVSWVNLYRAALFEKDLVKLPARIAEAEKALTVRARKLSLTPGDNIEEEQALDDARYTLHALRTSVELKTGEWSAA